MSASTRVCHVITGLYGGGAEKSLYNLVREGETNGIQHCVIALKSGGAYEKALNERGVPLYTLYMEDKFRGIIRIFGLMLFLARFRPNVIQGWMYHGNAFSVVVRILRGRQCALVWNVRQSLASLRDEKWGTRLFVRINRVFSRWPNMILYNSHVSREQHEALGFSTRRARIIPNGFDTEVLRPDSTARKCVREAFGVEDGNLVIGHVARFHPMKGHDIFLEAVVALARQDPRLIAVLIGREVQAENRALFDLIPSDLRDRFIFLGERSDVEWLMNGFDVFCISSRRGEAFSNVLGEAMAVGLPCVATDVGDSARVLGDAGYVVPAGDLESIREALAVVTRLPVEERHDLGARARARIQGNYSLDATLSAYDALYRELACMNGKRGG